ncbi:cytochrome D1 domain-containing protein [Xanthomonas sp. WHRI 8391]|uniref:YncE family protein n=1 Tax=Xanthomonas TaxID=338 RepID=UPI001A3612D5|nr:cytochrome D1 domain-containing protein [Xanthomonas hortorum]MBG3850576.1 hypothetical protein [Xanthomonas hortorum pv. carotae]UTS74831.1 hypothetical protein NMB96_08605 [Xanthomonas hortorum]
MAPPRPRRSLRTGSALAGLLLCALALAAPPPKPPTPVYLDRALEAEGVGLRLRLEALEPGAPGQPVAGQQLRLRIDARRLADGQPLNNWAPGAWLDRATDPLSGAVPVCHQRIAGFLSANLLQRPLLDLTGYYLLSLDAEPSVSVLDPAVSFSGRTSLLAAMRLEGRGFDWVKTSDDARLYVALPEARKLAVLDVQGLKTLAHVALQGRPTRLALQPGERLLWIGRVGDAGDSGVDVFDTVEARIVAQLPLPAGHHEIAFSDDGRLAYVSSREGRALAIVDTDSLAIVRRLSLDDEPSAVLFAPGNGLLWVVSARAGRIWRYSRDGEAVDTRVVERGSGPARLTPDARHVLLANPAQHRLLAHDAGSGALRHAITISGRPYDIAFSAQYAYVRALDSEQVALLSLASLDTAAPFLKFVPAGAAAPSASAELPRASSMAESYEGNGAFIATPAERTLYHYMEGMNAPDAGVRTYGHTPMAALLARRGLRQTGVGEYTAIVRLPAAGQMVMAIASALPKVQECIGLQVDAAAPAAGPAQVAMRWEGDSTRSLAPGERFALRVTARDAQAAARIAGQPLRLRIVMANGNVTATWPMHPDTAQPGVWVAHGALQASGGYYAYLDAATPVQLVFATLFVREPTVLQGAN